MVILVENPQKVENAQKRCAKMRIFPKKSRICAKKNAENAQKCAPLFIPPAFRNRGLNDTFHICLMLPLNNFHLEK